MKGRNSTFRKREYIGRNSIYNSERVDRHRNYSILTLKGMIRIDSIRQMQGTNVKSRQFFTVNNKQ